MSDNPQIFTIPGGLYNMVFEANPLGAAYLQHLLGLSLADVGRYRDVWLERVEGDDVRVAVYTRNGGGNRGHFDEGAAGPECTCTGCIITYHLPTHPLYRFDEDDGFDNTYATVYFSLPPAMIASLDREAPDWRNDIIAPVDTGARWQRMIKAIEDFDPNAEPAETPAP